MQLRAAFSTHAAFMENPVDKKASRSKSLAFGWAIYQQADIMVYYLIKKHTPPNRRTETIANELTLIF